MRPIIAVELAVVKVELAKSNSSLLGCKPSLRKRKDSTLMVATERRKWLALALLSAVQFMVVLDIAIVNVALPSIKLDLGFSQENLQWVISAYALFFGGFLLLGGRAADLLGRRRLFLAGIVLFTLASLLAGFAWSEASRTPARSFQAVGAAVISAASLSMLATPFTEVRELSIELGVCGAVGGLILGTATFSMFLMLTLYMQQVLGYSPMKTGVAYLAVAGSAILWSGVAAQLVNRIGVKPVLVTGMVALTSGLVYFTQVSVHGTYLSDLLPGFLLVGVGLGFSFVPISIAALAGVRPAEAGLASGLFNTTQQIGGALGIAVLSTIATSRTSHALADGTALPSALVHGFTGAFVVGARIAAVGIVAALTLIRRDELAQAPEQLEPVLDLAA